MSDYILEGKRIFVAGHLGMVGSAICRELENENCELITRSHAELDLKDEQATHNFFETTKPEVVFLAAAKVGGIQANRSAPVSFLEDNLRIQINTIRSAYNANIEKLIFLGSSCIYPKFAEQPINESSLLTGSLEPTNEWYALAKIAGIKLCQAYRQEHNCDYISAMPCNLYGEGDNFDLNTSHVLPALIRKVHEAKHSSEDVVVWGSGKPRREFLYADDAAKAIVYLAKNYSGDEHVNVGSNSDISIAELATLVAKVVGFTGNIVYDTSMPDGTPRKLMDCSKLANLGWAPLVELEQGVAKLYQWYLNSLNH